MVVLVVFCQPMGGGGARSLWEKKQSLTPPPLQGSSQITRWLCALETDLNILDNFYIQFSLNFVKMICVKSTNLWHHFRLFSFPPVIELEGRIFCHPEHVFFAFQGVCIGSCFAAWKGNICEEVAKYPTNTTLITCFRLDLLQIAQKNGGKCNVLQSFKGEYQKDLVFGEDWCWREG